MRRLLGEESLRARPCLLATVCRPGVSSLPVTTIGAAWRTASEHIDRLDARLLVQHLAGCRYAELLAHPTRPLPDEQVAQLESLVRRRVAGEPLAYLLGSADFHGLEFLVNPTVLIPRPETELLVELAIESLQGKMAPRVLDLGTGSGVLAVTIGHFVPATVLTAVDLSSEALAVARQNARRHEVAVRFLTGDWYSPLTGERYDLIVANPPYVADGDPHLQGNGLPFEPRMALTDGVSGGDGLACLRTVIGGAARHLLPGGRLLVEHGYDQAGKVRALLRAAGFFEVRSWRDLSRIERISGGSVE